MSRFIIVPFILLMNACNNYYPIPPDKVSTQSQASQPDTSAISLKMLNHPSVIAWQQSVKIHIKNLEQHGLKTSSGQIYDIYSMSAAHKFLPIGTWIELKSIKGKNKKVLVQINDRLIKNSPADIELSYIAAQQLGLKSNNNNSRFQLKTRTNLPPVIH